MQSPEGALSQACVGSAYSFTVAKNYDGRFDFFVSQSDPMTAIASASVSVVWTRDSPASDGIYQWVFRQSDLVGNISATVQVTWNRDSSIPSTPVITVPASVAVSNTQNYITISGSYMAGNLVTIAGNLVTSEVSTPSSSLTQTCSGSDTFTFVVNKSVDGTYALTVMQTNGSGIDSANATVSWTRDTLVPSPVILTMPTSSFVTSSGDLLVSGSCESAAIVTILGAIVTTSLCQNGSFSATATASSDGTYDMQITQADAAGNVSSPVTFQWSRNSSIPSTPIITSPSSSVYSSQSKHLSLVGNCTANYNVTISGISAAMSTSPNGSLNQVCSPSGTFAWSIDVLTDGRYQIAVTQNNGSVASAPAQIVWTPDTVAPEVTLTEYPANTTFSQQSTFAFNSPDSSATFSCTLNGGSPVQCTSPISYSSLTNGSHSFQVSARDPAGNVTSLSPHYWAVNARNTIALYNFDTTPGHLLDSSGFSTPYDSPLSTIGAVGTAAGKFNQGDVISSSAYLTAAHNGYTHGLASSTMTVEAYIKLTSIPTLYYTIASKSGSANEFGWKFQLVKTGSSSRSLVFNVSTNGTTWGTEVTSSKCAVSTTSFVHVAVTWNMGNVTFYYGGANKGTRTIGIAGSTKIFNSSAPVYIGSLAGSINAQMTIDEFRLSQIVRYNSAFTAPTSAFAAD